MYKLFLCLRYLRRRRIAFFAVAAVCLCVAMVLIVVSVMGGFLQMVKDRSRGMLGDLIVESETGALQGFPFYQELIDTIKSDLSNEVAEASPVIITYGVLRFPKDQVTKPVQIVGIKLDGYYRVNEFRHGLFYEKYYPGTTSLGPQKVPCFGLDEAGHEILPADLEAAWQRWRKSATPAELAKAPIEKEIPYQRPGYYRSIPISEDKPPESLAPAWVDRGLSINGELPGIILGTDLCAKRLHSGEYDRYCYRGEAVQVTFVPITDTGKITDATGMPSKLFRYSDDSRTGVYDIDSVSVYLDFDRLQQILLMDKQQLSEEAGGGTIPARATQVQIKLKDGANPLKTRDKIVQKWQSIRQRLGGEIRTQRLLDVEVKTWEEKQARFIAAVEKEKYLVTVLFGVISVVAVFLVGCIFYMIVQQKTRDIGIVKSVGATSLGVANIFIAYGAAVGVVGGALGTLIGTVFVWYINDIQDLLAWINPSLKIWDAEVYAFDRIPNHVNPFEAAVIYGIAIAASMLGSVIAAYRAARVWPVEALRYE